MGELVNGHPIKFVALTGNQSDALLLSPKSLFFYYSPLSLPVYPSSSIPRSYWNLSLNSRRHFLMLQKMV